MSSGCIHGLHSVSDSLHGCVLSIGNFDGVHLGHRRLIARARELAGEAPVVALTFDPVPDLVLHPSDTPQRLAPLDMRCRLLRQAGADAVVVARPDVEFLAQTPAQFIDNVIRGSFRPRCLVEGPNFFFGRARAGNLQVLREAGLCVETVEPVRIDVGAGEVRVSSTLIRGLLLEGRVADAARCLGRPYAIRGLVVHGRGLGGEVAFPTANLETGDQLVPLSGVYAGRAEVEGSSHVAAISIGTNPTFGTGPVAVEAFLLDGGGDLYGKTITLSLLHRLRAQEKFDDVASLRRQIAEDVENVRQLVG
jgi:riboflavin kinase/FMN adenylyltransferase